MLNTRKRKIQTLNIIKQYDEKIRASFHDWIYHSREFKKLWDRSGLANVTTDKTSQPLPVYHLSKGINDLIANKM